MLDYVYISESKDTHSNIIGIMKNVETNHVKHRHGFDKNFATRDEESVTAHKLMFGVSEYGYNFPGCGEIHIWIAYVLYGEPKYLNHIPDFVPFMKPKTVEKLVESLVAKQEEL